MPIDPNRSGPAIDAILRQLFGPINKVLERVPPPPTDTRFYTDNPNPSMLSKVGAGILGATQALSPGRLLPTGSAFPRNVQMPPGYRGDFWNRERGTHGALPEPTALRLPANEQGQPAPTFNQQSNTVWPEHDINRGVWPNIFRNMPDFPTSASGGRVTSRAQSADPYAGKRQGMARQMRNINWDEVIPRAVESIRDTGGISRIARELNIGESVLHRELTRRGYVGIPEPQIRRTWTQTRESRSAMANDIRAGERTSVIAQRYNTSPSNVSQLRRRLDSTRRETRLSDNLDEITRMYNNNVPLQQIANRFGSNSASAVRELLNRNGINVVDRRIGRRSNNQLTGTPINVTNIPAGAPRNIDSGVASMMRDLESRMLNNPRTTPEQVASRLRQTFGLRDNDVTPDMISSGNGWWRNFK